MTAGFAGPALRWSFLGRAAYRPVWELQEELRRRVQAGDEEAERVLFVEHEPVVTLGRSADRANVLAPSAELERRGVELVATSRGGDVTYHGPGQLVIYPVVRLRAGVVAHVESVGRAVAEVAGALGAADAAWRRSPAGVWVGDAKLAACGVHVSRRVAIHGFALNVSDEVLEGFSLIVPCGLEGARVTSLSRQLGAPPPALDAIARSVAERIALAWRRTPVCSCDRLPAR